MVLLKYFLPLNSYIQKYSYSLRISLWYLQYQTLSWIIHLSNNLLCNIFSWWAFGLFVAERNNSLMDHRWCEDENRDQKPSLLLWSTPTITKTFFSLVRITFFLTPTFSLSLTLSYTLSFSLILYMNHCLVFYPTKNIFYPVSQT